MGAVAAPGLAPKRARGERPASRQSAATRSRRAAHPRSARESGSRSGSARSRPSGQRRSSVSAFRIALLPFAIARRAIGAVGGLAETSLMVRMTQSRAWIVVLATLLGGIVALNVVGLGLGSSVTRTAALADQVERDNSLLREQISKVGTRRSARAAERASVAAATVSVEEVSEALPVDIVPAADAVPLEAPPVEAEAPSAPVDPSEQAGSQPAPDQSTGGGAVSAGGVGSP